MSAQMGFIEKEQHKLFFKLESKPEMNMSNATASDGHNSTVCN